MREQRYAQEPRDLPRWGNLYSVCLRKELGFVSSTLLAYCSSLVSSPMLASGSSLYDIVLNVRKVLQEEGDIEL